MFNSNYLEKLKVYLGEDINILDNDSEVEIYVDAEIQYFLRKNEKKYILYIRERGYETEEREYKSEIEMRSKFALLMKRVFCENIEYPFGEKFRDVKSIEVLENLMCQYTNRSLYSVDSMKKDKINLEQNKNGLYNIFFVDKNGNKNILEKNEEAPFVFKRFYNEVVYYSEVLKQIEEYEKIFDAKLDYDMKIQLLGY